MPDSKDQSDVFCGKSTVLRKEPFEVGKRRLSYFDRRTAGLWGAALLWLVGGTGLEPVTSAV